MIRRVPIIFGASLLACGTVVYSAPTPINAPGTINVPGRYVLVNDIVSIPYVADALVIDTSVGPIDIDLGGFTVTGAGVGMNAVTVSGRFPLRIRNGSLFSGNAQALQCFDATPITMERVNLFGDWGIWIQGSASLRLRESRVDATVYGVYADTVGDVIIERSAFGQGYMNARIRFAGKVRVKDSALLGGSQGPSLEVRHASRGVSVARNTLGGAGTPGGVAIAPDGARIHGNTIHGTGYDGLVLLGSNMSVLGNTIDGSGGDGLLVAGTGNSIRGNVITNSGSCGINLTQSGNSIQGNTFSGNAFGDICGAP